MQSEPGDALVFQTAKSWNVKWLQVVQIRPGTLQNEVPCGRARDVGRSQIRLGGVCFPVTMRTETALGEAKANIAPASCSLQILSTSKITKIYYLFAITF